MAHMSHLPKINRQINKQVTTHASQQLPKKNHNTQISQKEANSLLQHHQPSQRLHASATTLISYTRPKFVVAHTIMSSSNAFSTELSICGELDVLFYFVHSKEHSEKAVKNLKVAFEVSSTVFVVVVVVVVAN